MKCKMDDNKTTCPCTYDNCERRGICCECIRNHLTTRSLPACMKQLDWIKVEK